MARGTKGSTSFSYSYNADGLRTQKIVGNQTYTYYWNGSQLAMMTVKTGNNTITLKFYYDAEGVPFYFDYNGTKYFYITNLQGDVVGIANSYGIVGYYEYDAWGRILSINSASSNEYSALTDNPLRYRGYIYDNETGFYYLQSRYYDPAIRRFISADSYVSTGQGFIGYNMFAYCNNNPTNYYDPKGTDCICLRKRVVSIRHKCADEYEKIYKGNAEDCYSETRKCVTANDASLVQKYYKELSRDDYEAVSSVMSNFPIIGIISEIFSAKWLEIISDIISITTSSKDALTSATVTDSYGNELYIEKGYQIITIDRVYIGAGYSMSEVQYVVLDPYDKVVFNKTIINNKSFD